MDKRNILYESIMRRISKELRHILNEESMEDIAAAAFSETLGEQAANYLYDGIYKGNKESFITFIKMIKNNAINNTTSMKEFIDTFKKLK